MSTTRVGEDDKRLSPVTAGATGAATPLIEASSSQPSSVPQDSEDN